MTGWKVIFAKGLSRALKMEKSSMTNVYTNHTWIEARPRFHVIFKSNVPFLDQIKTLRENWSYQKMTNLIKKLENKGKT